MKSWFLVPLLGIICSHLQISWSQCDISKGNREEEFPNVESEGIESYQMSVEYTVPGQKQTGYYTEYYDILYRRGRVDSHQNGKSSIYIYRTESWEAWTIEGRQCTLGNVTDLPQLVKDDQSRWIYSPTNSPEKRTVGPSAMFKDALDVWNAQNGKMVYMGILKNKVRGLDVRYWRKRSDDDSCVDYFFSTKEEENAFGMKKLKNIPLKVVFSGKRADEEKSLSDQVYEIISFQPFISADIEPFQLPKGRNCKRGDTADTPNLPNFANKNLMFSAEVIYRVVDWSTGEDTKVWSFYSTLMFALDVSSQHLAYYYTPWNTTKPKDEDQEPFVNSPEYIIYDMKHGYAYKTIMETSECQIIREKDFVPEYRLPENGGSIALTDPYVLFPNNELSYITEGTDRGLAVDIFEGYVEKFILNKNTEESASRAYITHSYLKDNEIMDNTVSVKNALTQVQLRLFGRVDKKSAEVLTFNFYGFTTQLRDRRSMFNILRCFKNEDDYLWLTIGFNADNDVLQKIKDDAPSVQSNILNLIEMQSELNAVRMPIILVDVKDAVYVTILILGKPPLILDYESEEKGKTIANTQEVQGLSNFESCAAACLETEDNCWAFSICGEDNKGVCYFAASSGATIAEKQGCSLYRRYNNETFVPSKELMVTNIRREVEQNQVKLVLPDKDGKPVQIEASSVEVTVPGEDDSLFDKMGNELDPRMRVLKAGMKLKSNAGSAVKNFGKIRYDECQRLCLDFKACETVSYCLKNSECILSKKYGDDIKSSEMEEDNLCNLLARKYGDHFTRSPGITLSVDAEAVLDKPSAEECARACLTETGFRCLSFDHCPGDTEKKSCRLHTVHYTNPKSRDSITVKKSNCGHYVRKFSTEYQKTLERRYIGSKVPPLTNVTLEDCAKSCKEYGKGKCFGFDFCQDVTLYATSCTLLDQHPSKLNSSYSPICTNFLPLKDLFASPPYSTSYAGGIGFLCFIVGGIVGAVVVFIIAYIRVNRR